MRRVLLALALCVVVSVRAHAQISRLRPGRDGSEHASPPSLKEYLLNTAAAAAQPAAADGAAPEHVHQPGEVPVPDPPRWRTTTSRRRAFLFTQAYHAALNYGDPPARAFLAVSHPVRGRARRSWRG